MTPQVKDRRKHRRIVRSREAAVFLYTDAHEKHALVRGRLADISAGGAALQSNVSPDVGALGELKVQFEGFQLVSESRVVRSWSGGFAVEFTDMEGSMRGAVDLLEEDPPLNN